MAVAVKELQLDTGAVLEAVGVEGGAAEVLVIAGHGVGVEVVRSGGGLGLQCAAGVGVVVAAQSDGDQRRDQHQNGDDRQNTADDPAAAQADSPSGLGLRGLFCHGSPSSPDSLGALIRPICSHSPTR